MQTATAQLLQQLRALGDATRLRLVALCRQGECSVSELTRVVGQSQPRISQQLKVLCEAGLLERFRDGKRVFYRVPTGRGASSSLHDLLELVPDRDPLFEADWQVLLRGRGDRVGVHAAGRHDDTALRALHRAILDLTVTAPVGDLLDVGCGRGAILKLLASRVNRAVGVDIDTNARQLARAELMLAGIPNCSLRKGDMYRLPFTDAEFNTIIIDDVLVDARRPVVALREARRLLRPGGRLFIVESVLKRSPAEIQASLATWSKDAALRLAPGRLVPQKNPAWLVSVATAADRRDQAA